MSLLDTLRSGIKIANSVTRPLQATVMYARKTSANGYGPAYAVAVPLHAIVDFKATQVMQHGTLITARATVTLIDIVELNAATNSQGISNDDMFTLPDGYTGPAIVPDITGFLDAGTGRPMLTEVMLG